MNLFNKIKRYFKDRKKTKILRRYFETCCRECPYLSITLVLERKICRRNNHYNLPCDPYRCTYIGEKIRFYYKKLEEDRILDRLKK